MKERLSKRGKVTAIISAVIILCIAVAITVGLYLREDKLEELQNEAISELERNEGEYDERSIVLGSTSKARAEELAALFGAELRITENGRYARLTLPEGVSIVDVYSADENRQYLEEMSADWQVKIAGLEGLEEENYEKLPVRPTYTVSDAEYDQQTYLDYINMQNLWYNYTGSGVTVAVIDTGIDTDHPEFAGRISEYSYNVTEDKIVKDWGYDWSLIEDEQGHGTAVTGVIAASMNSGNVVGIAPNVNIIVIKAECDESGNFKRTSDLVFGLYYAIERDVQVVNMSFGTSSADNDFAAATQLAYDSDVICVVAAGNDGTAALNYPAAVPNVISVGALAEDSWTLAYYSNYGENVDIVAPGTVYTTLKGGKYGKMSGTSLSSPMVAGAVALFMQNNKYTTFDEVIEVLFASSYDLGARGRDWDYGYGALDVYSFVCGERGTVTYDMLTDELENEEGLFIRGIALQEFPEPERLYAVFDGWYYDYTLTQAVDYYADAFEGDITIYAKWVNEDDGIPYTYVILDDGTVEIRSYTGRRRFITIPEMIEGRIVSSIGDFAFAGQTRLREVTLPSGLNNIGRYAFKNCANLVTMEIPAGVKTIAEYAFENNVRLYTLSFDANSVIESIGEFAFSGCGSLERIELPASLTSVDGSVFYGTTALTTISVASRSASFVSKDGVLFDITGRTLVAYPAAHGTTYTVPASTVNIADLAFPMARIKSIDLGQVQTIGGSAFIYSTLESLVIPDSVISMGGAAFASNSSLSSLTVGRGLNSISYQSFANCVSLNTVLIPNNIVVIDGGAFAGSGLRAVVFESGSKLSAIGSEAFSKCRLTDIYIPSSVGYIGKGAFSYTPLVRVRFEDGSMLHTIDKETFTLCIFLESIILPDSLKTIDDEAFMYCKNLKSITLPSGVQKIAEKAFMYSGLESISIPASVTSLEKGAFTCCDALTSIEIEEGNTVYHDIGGVVYSLDNTVIYMYPAGREESTYIIETATRKVMPWAFAGTSKLGCAVLPEGMYLVDEYAFYLCGATTYVLPTTLTHIMAHAFDTSYNLSSITLPYALVEISEGAFSNCSMLTYIHIPDNVKKIGTLAFAGCYNLNKIEFNYSTSKLPRISFRAFAYSGISSFTVPSNVSTMAQYAFEGCANLNSITFAENSKLESLAAYVFDRCDNIQSITFMPGSNLTSIQAHALEGMPKITNISLNETKLANLDNFAFRFCQRLSNVTFPETLESIGRYAFYGCESLSELTVPANVEHIGSYAFLGTNSLNLYLSADSMPAYLDENWDHGIAGYYVGVTSVNTLGDYKYATLTSGNIAIIEYLGSDESVDLTTLDLGGPISAIGGRAFKDSTLKNIVLPETLTEIQAEAFMYTALEKITIPASVTFIGREAFAHTDIAALNIPTNSSLKYIEQYAFEGTDNLKLAILPASLEKMGTGAFMESGLESVIFADGIKLEEIPQRAFEETKLIAVSLPDSVTLVNHNAFNNVETLQSVSFGNNDGIRLMSNAFYHTGLASLHIPANVTYIGEYCFVALKNLTSFTVDANNPNYTAIDGLLVNKSGRKLIAVPAGRVGTLNVPVSIEEIGFGAFEESSLSAINFDPNANILTFGYRAFFKAENITEMNIPASVVSIDYYAFAYCENLTTVNFAEGNKLKGIYEGAFCGCINLSNIIIPDSIVEISDFAFYGCSKITKLPISETSEVKGIYDYAFAYTGLSGDFTTPETLIDIGNYAFLGCKFTKVTIPDTNKKQLLIGIGAFEGCNKLTEITLPFIGASFEDEEISWFGYIFGAGAYEANKTYVPASLKTVTITDGITFIGIGGFAYCTGLEAINVPHSVSVVWLDSFVQTTARYELTNKITTKLDGRFVSGYHFGTGIVGHLRFSDDVTSIGWDALSGCNKLTSVTIPKGLTDIGSNAFANCSSLSNIYIEDLRNWIEMGGLGLYNDNDIHLYLNGELITDLSIPNGVTRVLAFENCVDIVRVRLPDTVTSIGYRAFYGCRNLNEIQLSSGLTSIDEYAFENCSSLISVEIPDSLTTIKDNAFYNCKKLSEIKLSQKLTSIGKNAFYGCNSITDIMIPDSLISIGTDAFMNCMSIRNIYINDVAAWLNISYENDYSNPMNSRCAKELYVNGKPATHLTIPEGVESIGNYAFFNCGNIVSVTIPSSVKSIGNYAFQYCKKLYEIENKSGLSLTFGSTANGYLAYYAKAIIDNTGNRISKDDASGFMIIDTPEGFKFKFENGLYTLLLYTGDEKTITLPESINGCNYDIYYFSGAENVIIPECITSISEKAFCNCTSLQSVFIPNSVTTISSGAFSGCSNLISVNIPDSVTTIGESAFRNCSDLANITLLGKLNAIEDWTFDGCESLTSVTIPDSVTKIGEYAFRNCSMLANITLSNQITTIGECAFEHCLALENIDFPVGLLKIGYAAFSHCSNLSNINIPDSVTYIARQAFYECSSLKNIVLSESLTNINQRTFFGCTELVSVTIPDGVTTIEESAFGSCSSLENVTIPDSVTSIGLSAFPGTTSLNFVGEDVHFTMIGGILYDYPVTKIVYVSSTIDPDVVIPEGVTVINSWNFGYRTDIVSVTLPESVVTIEQSAFYECTSLKKVIMTDSVTSIGKYAFNYCSALTDITLPSNLESFGDWLMYCSSLESIEIPYGVKSIESGAFWRCSKLKNVIIPNSVTSIGSTAFGLCPELDFVTIPESVTNIAKNACDANTTLLAYGGDSHYITIDGILYDYPITKIIHIPSKVSSNLVIPEGVTSIDGGAFDDHKEIISVTLPESVTSIGSIAFRGCTNLEAINIPNSVTNIGSGAFEKCVKISEITLPNKLTTIQKEVFYQCTGLLRVNIPDSVTSIERGAFHACFSLSSIDIPAGATSVHNNAFLSCLRLFVINNHSDISDRILLNQSKKIVIDKNGNKVYKEGITEFEFIDTPEGFRFIKENGKYYLFEYLGTDEEITLPKDCNGESYDILQFRGAKKVIIPEGITSINREAFYNCLSMTDISIPNSVTQLSSDAFWGCYNLENVKIGNGIKQMESGVFNQTAISKNPDNWKNGMLLTDGWLIKVDTDVEYLTDFKSIRGAALGVYENCYKLKNIIWNGSLDNTTNVETVIMPHVNFGILPEILTLKNIVLLDSVGVMELYRNYYVFQNYSDITIYIEAVEKDLRWDANFPGWNNGNVVVYGDNWHWVNFYDETGKLIYSEPVRNSAVIKPPVYIPESEGEFEYVLLGWDLDGDGIVDSIPATSIVDIEAHAVVAKVSASYTVKFMAKDRTTVLYSYELPYLGEVVLPEDPALKGYTFKGWTGYTEGMLAESDIFIYSEWEHNDGGHNYAEFSIAPTCTERGFILHLCSICNESYKTDFVPASGHSFGDWVIDKSASCIEYGERHRVCSVCGEVETQQIIPDEHDFEVESEEEATCEKEGMTHYRCRRCHFRAKRRIPRKDHHYNKHHATPGVRAWLETMPENVIWGYENGEVYYYMCEESGHVMMISESAEISSSGASVQSGCSHSSAEWKLVPNTMCDAGVQMNVCTSCEKVIEMRIAETANSHNYGSVVVKPQFGVPGYTLYTCSVCLHSYKDNFTDPLTYLPGDIDGNEKVDAADAETLLKYITGHDIAVVEDVLDVNGDGKVNIRDAAMILFYLEGKITELN